MRDMHPPLRVLALGDSYTIGEAVTPQERWIAQYIERMRKRGVPVEEPTVIARTGWTTDELEAAIMAADPRERWDLVTLLIGVNDQYRGRHPDEYRPRFRDLLATALRYGGNEPHRVLVLSIPDWGVTPFARGRGRDAVAVAREIDRYNEIAREEAHARGVTFIDITPVSREAAEDPSLLTADGLHPSREMYARWVDQIEAGFVPPPPRSGGNVQ